MRCQGRPWVGFLVIEVLEADGQDVVVVGLQGGTRNLRGFPFDPSAEPSLGPPGRGALVGSQSTIVLDMDSAFSVDYNRMVAYVVGGGRVEGHPVDGAGNVYSGIGRDLGTATGITRMDSDGNPPLFLVGSSILRLLRGDNLADLKTWSLQGSVGSVATNPERDLALAGTSASFPNRFSVNLADPDHPALHDAVDRGTLPSGIQVVRTWPSTLPPPLEPVTKRVTLGEGGVQPDAACYGAHTNGEVVVFSSAASNLVPGDTNGLSDVFLRDMDTGAVTLLSAPPGGGLADGDSSEASLSEDGRFVAFSSSAANLVPGDTNGVRDVFLHDRQSGTTARVSLGAGGE